MKTLRFSSDSNMTAGFKSSKRTETTSTISEKTTLNSNGNHISSILCMLILTQLLLGIAHTRTSDDVLQEHNVDPLLGLSFDKAKQLAEEFGPNRLKPPPRPSILKIFGRQIGNAMVIVLIAAMAVSFGTQDWIEGKIIYLFN